MDIFKEVRERADILEVCDVLGIKLNRHYKAICPFKEHKEKTASFSISPSKNIFCCFGCGKKGNSITLVQELLQISPLEAAKYINYNLSLGIDVKKPMSYFEINKYRNKRRIEETFKKWEIETLRMLCDYLQMLKVWEKEKDWQDDLYIEAVNNKDYVEYLIDIFIYGTNDDKIWFWKYEKKVVSKFEARVRAFRKIA